MIEIIETENEYGLNYLFERKTTDNGVWISDKLIKKPSGNTVAVIVHFLEDND